MNIAANVATDAAGNPNTATPQFSITFDTVAPAVTIDPVISPTNIPTQTITGAMEAGATVTLSSATATFGAVTHPTDTTWNVVAILAEGSNVITVTATDAAGNTGTATTTIVLDTRPFAFSLAVEPSAAAVPQGDNITTATVTATLGAGIAENVTLTAELPAGVAGIAVAFVPSLGEPTFASLMTITTAADATPGVHPITITGTGAGGLVETITFALTVILQGDLNIDGEVNIFDVILCLRLALDMPVTIERVTHYPPHPEWLIGRADMNADGEVNIFDVILVLRKALGLDL